MTIAKITGAVSPMSEAEKINELVDGVNAAAVAADLATVALTGAYDDLTGKPTIPTVPTNVSAFNNDAGYLTTHQDISGKADDNAVVHLTGDETIGGNKIFSATPVVGTMAVSDNSTKAASTAYVNEKHQKVSTLPASPNADIYYYIPE